MITRARISIDESLMRSVSVHDELAFSSRTDYEDYFVVKGYAKNAQEIWENEEFVHLIQRHWHRKGQSGCVFAQAAASKGEQLGWKSIVINKPTSYIAQEDGVEYCNAILQEAIDSPHCESISLLFPRILVPQDLVILVKSVTKMERVACLHAYHENTVIIGLRAIINPEGVLSWMVGFGPFSFLARTRQAPITELAIRTKSKPERMFDRLNQDRHTAHLADIPLGLSNHVMSKLWDATYTRTRKILGHTSRLISSAKITYNIPTELWDVSS